MLEVELTEIVQIYAPKTGSEECIKEVFYKTLSDVVRDDKTIILGDFNAQVEENRTSYDKLLGVFEMGIRNKEVYNLLGL